MSETGSSPQVTAADLPPAIEQNNESAPSPATELNDSVPRPDSNIVTPPPVIDCETSSETKNKRQTSVVWLHFKKQKINGVDKAICNYCEKKLSGKSKNGTTHLHEHFKICPLRKHRDIKQSILNPTKKKDGTTTLGSHTFDQQFSREELAKMIILHEYPLNMVEHIGFRSFVNSIQPLFKHVSRPTIRSDIIKIYESEKTKLKKLLSTNQSRIAVTSDMWTATNQKRGYMVVTAHYIDDSWILHSQIIR
jgi:hypothetical protein